MSMDIKSRSDRDNLVVELTDWIKEIERSREKTDALNMELWKNYNSIRSKRFYTGDADIFVPFSFMVVETMMAKMMRAIWNDAVPVPLSGIGPNDKDREERIRALLHSQQKSQVNLKLKVYDYLLARCIFSRAYARISWRTDYRKVKSTRIVEPEPETPELDELGQPVLITEEPETAPTEGGIAPSTLAKVETFEQYIPEYDCWDVENLDFFDVGVDPTATNGDIQRARFVYIRSLITDDDLRVMAAQTDGDDEKIYSIDKEARNVVADEGLVDDVIDKKELIGIDVRELDKYKNPDLNGRHELHEIYYDYDIDGDHIPESKCLFYLLNRKILIRAEKNPWWHGKVPIMSGSHFRRPNEFMGQSLLQPVRKIQYEINDKRNQELDGTTLSLIPTWLVGDDAAIEDSQIRVTQGGAIRVGDINQIKPIVIPDMSHVGQRAEAIMESNLREAIGVTKSQQGVADGGRQSATEFSQLLAQAGERTRMSLELFAIQEWRELWSMAHSLNQQFLKKSTFLKLTERESLGFPALGAEGEVSQADLTLDMDFTADTFSDIEIESIRNGKLMGFFQEIAKLPPTPNNATFFNIMVEKLWVDVLKMPREDLIDDQGNPLLLTHPGAQSIFDEDTKMKLAQQQADLTPEDPATAAAPGVGGQDLAQAASIIPTGGPQ